MLSSRIDLAVHVRKESVGVLQQILSDALDLEAQLKQAHWNVRGNVFFQLHELFDKIHADIEDIADTVAERIAALGGTADGRVQTTARATSLYEYSVETRKGEDHLRAIAGALAQFGKSARLAIDVSVSIGDADTSDVLTQVSRQADKNLWFVEAHFAE